jgi:penicillin-binding protein 1C
MIRRPRYSDLGPLAAWYVNDILTEAPAPPGGPPAEVRRGRPLAFKTGTSYGYRDFWAIGYDREVTIGVWAGRPDGTPMPGRSGRLTAAPVMFKIADLVGSPSLQNGARPPSGALLLGRNDLPPAFEGRSRPLAQSPPAGHQNRLSAGRALIEWHGEEISLEASGGKRPFRWLVDGKPLAPEPPRRPVYWQPEGIGFSQLTVIDAEGRSARSTVRLSP